MGKPSKGAVIRAVDPNVVEFVDAASVGDLRRTKKLIKSGKIEIDDGESHFLCACGTRDVAVWCAVVPGLGRWC